MALKLDVIRVVLKNAMLTQPVVYTSSQPAVPCEYYIFAKSSLPE